MAKYSIEVVIRHWKTVEAESYDEAFDYAIGAADSFFPIEESWDGEVNEIIVDLNK